MNIILTVGSATQYFMQRVTLAVTIALLITLLTLLRDLFTKLVTNLLERLAVFTVHHHFKDRATSVRSPQEIWEFWQVEE